MIGFACVGCGSRATMVTDSRGRTDGFIRRRRKCPDCGARFTTTEVPEAVIKGLNVVDQRDRLRDDMAAMLKSFRSLSHAVNASAKRGSAA